MTVFVCASSVFESVCVCAFSVLESVSLLNCLNLFPSVTVCAASVCAEGVFAICGWESTDRVFEQNRLQPKQRSGSNDDSVCQSGD